jgi:L-glyceraldehyde 3-phosphate reductase
MTSTLVGASSIEQLEQNLRALKKPDFTAVELEEIERYATDSGINIWAASSEN